MKRISSLILLLVIASGGHSSPTGCQNDEWQCMDGACISQNGRCDNFPDCLDNSDEKNCTGPVCLEGLEACPQPNGTTVCVEKAVGCNCGPVKVIANGKIDGDNVTIGSVATVTCDAGYDATLPTVTCQVTGLWETVSCIPKDCGTPGKIAFGKITLTDIDNTKYGANADVVCDLGFETLTPVIRCDEKGSWETAVCTAKDCGAPGKIAFGKVILRDINNTTYGANADVVCDVGFETLTSVIKCDEKGSWEAADCTARDCGTPEKIAFGKVILSDINNTTYGANADVVCDVGFETLTPVIKCDEKGSWETAVCTAKDCGAPGKIAFGKVILSDINNTTYGANADVVCDVGFETLTPVIKCDEKGSWETAVCTAKDCGTPEKIGFGKVILSDINNTTYGANADVVCDVGFETLTPVIKCDEKGSWETAVCKAKDCGAPGKIAFGKVILRDINNTTYGTNADVVCDVGFETLTPVIKCDEKGSWETADCTAKDCGTPEKIAFGKVILSDINNTTYGANADVVCDVGFETLTPVIKCDEKGSWETAVCTAKDCGAPGKIGFGTVILSDINNTTYGANADVVCDVGFETLTPVIKCDEKGSWEAADCTARDCGSPEKIAFGKVILSDINNTTYGANADVVCDVGFETLTPVIKCDEKGSWETAVCTPKGCGLVPEISHGTIKTPANDSAGSFASVVCDKGYEANVSSVFCQISGQWESASCTIKDCGHTPAIPFGQIFPNNRNITTYGASANVTCYTGYTTNVSQVFCQSSGEWEKSSCQLIDCGPPPSIRHGSSFLGNDNKTTYGATALVDCQDNYVATMSIIQCQSSGFWENATCVFKGCGAVPKISHGTIKAPSIVFIGSIAYVTCDTGYEANVSSIMCKWPGLWETASCKAKDCGHPPVILYGQSRLIDYKNTSYGASANVTCFRGYEPNVSRILCQSTGVWQAAACQPKNCGPLPLIKNGNVSLIGRFNTTVGAIAVVSCNDFYVATRRFIKCLSSGKWQNATCIPKGCGPVPTILHGRITAAGNASVGSTAFVTCDEGYTANVSSVMCKSSGLWEQANCSATNSTSVQCYKCRYECSNDICNWNTEVCPRNKQACETVVLWKHGYYTLKKGCKRPSANTGNARSKCRRFGFKIVCRYECSGNLCNWDIPSINLYR